MEIWCIYAAVALRGLTRLPPHRQHTSAYELSSSLSPISYHKMSEHLHMIQTTGITPVQNINTLITKQKLLFCDTTADCPQKPASWPTIYNWQFIFSFIFQHFGSHKTLLSFHKNDGTRWIQVTLASPPRTLGWSLWFRQPLRPR